MSGMPRSSSKQELDKPDFFDEFAQRHPTWTWTVLIGISPVAVAIFIGSLWVLDGAVPANWW